MHIIKGSYDKNVYVLDIESGALVWNIETNDVVKSSPCLDLETGYVFFGSHDKHFYCVNIEVGVYITAILLKIEN